MSLENLASNATDKLDEDEQQDYDGSPATEFVVAHIG
jgi:hypothetical protein